MVAALKAGGWGVWVDTEDIPPTADWSEELAVGIRTAHTFVFAISPRSVRSQYCLRELDQALQLGKRLVPVVLEESDEVPEPLAARQYVYLRDEDDFDASLQTLTTALATDLDWVREHRHWLTEALRWDANGRDRSLLLRGRDLKSAEAWLARQAERTEPRPTRLQAEFLIASRSWNTRRLRITVASVVLALAVSVLLGILALLQRDAARRQAAIARSRELAIASSSKLSIDPALSLLLAIDAVEARPTAEADNALRRAVAANRPLAEVHVPGDAVRSLVSDVAFAPNGNAIAVALENGTVRLAQLRRRGARLVPLPLPKPSGSDLCSDFLRAQGHTRLAFSRDGRWLAAVGDKSLIALWRLPHPTRAITSRFCLGRTRQPAATDVATATFGGSGFGAVAVGFAGDRTLVAMEENGRLIRWRWRARAAPASERVGVAPVVAAAIVGHDGRGVLLADRSGVEEWISGRPSSGPPPDRRRRRGRRKRGREQHRCCGRKDGQSLAVWRDETEDADRARCRPQRHAQPRRRDAGRRRHRGRGACLEPPAPRDAERASGSERGRHRARVLHGRAAPPQRRRRRSAPRLGTAPGAGARRGGPRSRLAHP